MPTTARRSASPIAAYAAVLLASSAAVAQGVLPPEPVPMSQDAPMQPELPPLAASDAPMPELPPMGAAPSQGQPPVEAPAGNVDPALAAKYPVQPVQRDGNVSMEGIGESMDTVANTAVEGLDRSAADSKGPKGKAKPPRQTVTLPEVDASGDLEAVQRDRQVMKEIRSYQLLNQKADQINKLYEKVYNNHNAIASRLADQKAEATKKEEAEKAKVQASVGQPQNVLPVVVEVVGPDATIFSPSFGMVLAREGTRLANGMQVVSIGGEGVAVRTPDGRSATLGFGVIPTVDAK